MTHLDLFSGIGGFALAARWTGWQTIGFSEIDPYATKILKRHWPDVPNYGDIRNVRNVQCDLITGGFPCQPYSLAGKRGGSEDDRALWPEMLRVIVESRPRWVLGENVVGIVSMELDRVLSDLENIGYSAWPLVIPACAVDARHRRNRVWIVANSEGNGCGRRLREDDTQQHGAFTSNGCPNLADASIGESGQPAEWEGRQDTGGGSQDCGRATDARCETVANGDGSRTSELPRAEGRGAGPGQSGGESLQGNGPARWLPEPGVGRVANGIPNRPHRLRGLGNAIVPQVAATILGLMLEPAPPHLSDADTRPAGRRA